MSLQGRVLLVDDEAGFRETYAELLRQDGHLVHCAATADEAVTELEQADWDVVLLDQKLRGPGGPDQGLDLVDEVSRRAPGARTIIVTAYASDDAIRRAFDAGAYDYVEKSGRVVGTLLRRKVSAIVQMNQAHRLSAMAAAQRRAELQSTWDSARSESDSHAKGALLEQVLVLLATQLPGFVVAFQKARSADEEIDVLLRNESDDSFWMGESRYVLVECKNWSKPVERKELDAFMAKLERRYGRCRLGIFVAMSGFTAGFKTSLDAERKGEHLALLLDAVALDELVRSTDINARFKEIYDAAVVGANGHR